MLGLLCAFGSRRAVFPLELDMVELFFLLLALVVLSVVLFWTGFVLLYYLHPAILNELFERWMSYRAGFTWKFVSVGNFRFCYMERGQPSKMENSFLFIHGFSGAKDVWCQMAKAFPKMHHLIALDLPGHGKSTRKFSDDFSIPSQVAKLHQFVQAIGLDRKVFHLVGISMGGYVAGIFAARHPSFLSSLTLMCPAGINAPRLSDFISKIAQGGKNYLLPETPEDFQVMLEKVTHKGIALPFFMLRIFTETRRPCNDFFRKVLDDITHPDQRFLLHSALEDIAVPTLVLWGENDQILDVSAVDVIKEKMSNCEVHILDRCGHAVSFERPWKSAKLIMQFIASHRKNQ